MNKLEISKKLNEKLEKHAKYIYEHPEVGFETYNTATYVINELKNLGLSPKHCGTNGVVAEITGNGQGKVFLLRADMDALCGLDKDNPDKCMHACGHHFHTAMLLGAAEILIENKNEFCGTIRLMFQPAEEILEGAKNMIENGILEDPIPSGAMMIHVMSGVDLPTGTIVISSPGISAPAVDFFNIEVIGKGTHGAISNLGIDPIVISAHIITAISEISSREVVMGSTFKLSMGKIFGGESANVIPDRVIMQGSLRTFDEGERSFCKKRLIEITQNIATAFRAKALVDFKNSSPCLDNDEKLSFLACESLTSVFGADKVITSDKLKGADMRGGSEDFAYIAQSVPSITVSVSAGSKTDGYEYPLHNKKVRFDNKALSVGAKAYAAVALSFLQKNNSRF